MRLPPIVPYSRVPDGEGDRLSYDWGEIRWIVSGARGNSDAITFGRVTIRAGRSNPPHSHSNCDEVLYLLSGQLEHAVGGDICVLRPGDAIVIRRGVAHHARAVGEHDAVMVVTYPTPERQIRHEA